MTHKKYIDMKDRDLEKSSTKDWGKELRLLTVGSKCRRTTVQEQTDY
jgi:hypothetical protein